MPNHLERSDDHAAERQRHAEYRVANVAMRKALDLFANIRPVKVPEEGHQLDNFP